MFERSFLTDLLERAVATALQGWAAAFLVPGPSILDSIKIGAVAGLVSVAKAITARKVGDDSASLVRNEA
tara:strand:+ start:1154 stop:1363 length:210 start_codon:yes stop_codon:yes gene_type:complete